MAAKKADGMPEWVIDGIRGTRFGKPRRQRKTGYILKFNGRDSIDVQLYEPVEDGRHIVMMGLAGNVNAGDLDRDTVYDFTFDMEKAVLGAEVAGFLQERGIGTGDVYRFTLNGAEPAE